MSDFRFSTEVTVRFAETDAQGVAHNANYLVWFEVARVAYLAKYAGGYPALREQGLESFVLESHVRYRLPAHFDDRLHIHARIGELRGARFRFDYEVRRNGEPLSSSTVRPTSSVGSGTFLMGGGPVTTSGAVSLTTRRCTGVP